jgi:hypothetical protein
MEANKTTVREELEYWNVIYVFRRLNDYYRNRLRFKIKDLQGLESNDFAMQVLEKVISEDVSWMRSEKSCFIDFIYDVARGELSHFVRANKDRSFLNSEEYEMYINALPSNRLTEHFNGF